MGSVRYQFKDMNNGFEVKPAVEFSLCTPVNELTCANINRCASPPPIWIGLRTHSGVHYVVVLICALK